MTTTQYISITGLRLKGRRHTLRFWWHATRSMAQARRADGNTLAQARTLNGVHHTLSVWRDKKAMTAFLTTGAHRRAMQAFPRIAEGLVVGYCADVAPSWDEVPTIWRTRGRSV